MQLKKRFPIITVDLDEALAQVTPLETVFENLARRFDETARTLMSENPGEAGVFMQSAGVTRCCAERMHGNRDRDLFNLSWVIFDISDLVEEPFRCLEHMLATTIPTGVRKRPERSVADTADAVFTLVERLVDEPDHGHLMQANHELGIVNHTEYERDRLYPWRIKLGRRAIEATEICGYSYNVTRALCESSGRPVPEGRDRYNYGPFPYLLVE